MLLMDQANQIENPPAIQIFASDIDEHAINIARKGIYPLSIITDVPPAHLRQFFTRHEDHYLIQKSIRDRILFASHNLLRDPPFSRINMISCRNLLIYLNRNVQAQVLEMFHFALRPNGILFLGSSESADSVNDLFIRIDKKNRIYRAKPIHRSANLIGPRTDKVMPRLNFPKKSERQQLSFSQIHQLALMQYGPVSLLVDADSNIVHMSDRASRFLRFNAGEPSRNLLSLVLHELRLELRTVLYQVTSFKTLLELEGAKVLIATNAKEGLKIVAQEKIDLLISDISMPEMNGYEFIEKVRQMPIGKKLPAIALSGLSREQDIAQCYKAGFSAHFNKPISLDRLTSTIIKLIDPPRENIEKTHLH